MLKKFPNFSKLDISLQHSIEKITKRFEPYSDFNFVSLFCWDINDNTAVSNLNDNLVIRLPNYLDGTTTFSILGDNEIEKSIDELLTITKEIKLTPEVVINQLANKQKYQIEEDRDNFDYIYRLEDLSLLAGNNYKKKRNKHNVFIKDHGKLELKVEVTKTLTLEHIEQLQNVVSLWEQQTPRERGDTFNERAAINKLLVNSNDLNLLIVEIFANQELKGFSVNEIIDENYAICHFEKALRTHHANIYTFLASEAARKLSEHGCKKVNWEQDLGLEGLRESKLSYHPEKFLRKYSIKLADR